jgi:hypothetical protein
VHANFSGKMLLKLMCISKMAGVNIELEAAMLLIR